MAQAVNIQICGQVIRLEDFLEAPCEGRWSKEAQKEKEKCEAGEISQGEFAQWLKR